MSVRYQLLATACFDAGHFPNPISHSVAGCPICELLAREIRHPPRPAVTSHAFQEMYDRVKRPVREGSLHEAIKMHAQACGLVAYVYDVHPDEVAEAVRDHRISVREVRL